jgi:NAD(P)-dependent dehydrogenase (short-subunit alcohol dehydrogenase family)
VADYLTDLFNLPGKVAAVTGGGGFLCGSMARAYGRAGMSVVVLDVRADKAEVVAEEIRAAGGKAKAAMLDVTDLAAWEAALALTVESYGHCDVLINGAGHNASTPFLEIPIEEWNAILASHVTGTMLGCQVFGRHMVARGSGSIINMSSASAGPPLSKAFTYSVAKAGIRSLTQNLGREWGKAGVRVNALRPGFFPTQWSMNNFIDPQRQAAIFGHTPMARYGQPEELSGAVLWLASDASGFVTGSEITVDGGFTCMTI